jgi:DNA ligase D-like protein (predicted ligase)
MHAIFDVLKEDERGDLKTSTDQHFDSPMLATLTHDYFSDANWIYERKLDGERCIARSDDSSITLISRNHKDISISYPEVRDALAMQDAPTFLVDGEIVAFEEGLSSFSALQGRMHVKDETEARSADILVFYYLFDVLHIDGYDVTSLALRTRKSLLRRLFSYKDPLRYTQHRNEEGLAYYEEACSKGWEGIIAKDARSTYVQTRSRKWLKFKCIHQQEFVIGGYTEPKGERTGFGALLIGYYDDDALRYAGKVGTGFDDDLLESLGSRLASLERSASPFSDDVDESGAHWVEPKLVGEVGFTEWTGHGKLRHPRFLGLRRDKSPRDVVREEEGS